MGTSGDDSITTGNGDDSVSGGGGNDTVSLGGGNDTFGGYSGEGGNDLVYGGEGDDCLNGGDGDDTLHGEAGDDTLIGSRGNDRLYGGDGADYFSIEEDHETTHVDGGDDNSIDRMWFFPEQTNDGVTVTYTDRGKGNYAFNSGHAAGTFTGIEEIGGTSGDDTFDASASDGYNLIALNEGDDLYTGGTGMDEVHGGDGGDTILTGAGDDYVDGGSGADSISGGDGNDTLYGGGGDDSIDAGAGDDFVSGGGGNDQVTLGDGADTFGASGSAERGDDTVYGGAGDDCIFGGDGDDRLYGDAGDDTLRGGVGDDSLYGGTGADVFSIGDGDDTTNVEGGSSAGDVDRLSFFADTAADGVRVTFSGADSGSYGFNATSASGSFTEIEAVTGTDHDDVVNASAASGDLDIDGGAGDDRLDGGSGDDTIRGGLGDDTLIGGAGTDILYGGEGTDQFVVVDDDDRTDIVGGTSGWDEDRIVFGNYTSVDGVTVMFTDNTGGNYSYVSSPATGSFTEIEAISGTAYDDTIDASASALNVTLWGMAGDDSIVSGSGYDIIYGGDGADTISSGDGNDLLYGGDGDDSISAGAGDDRIHIDDGGGADTLDLGAGHDTIQLSTSGAAPTGYTVTFTGSDGGTIDLAATGVATEFSNAEVFDLSDQADVFDASASTGAVTVWAADGADTLTGGSGSDVLSGADGDDLIHGGAGDDSLFGDAGDDTLHALSGENRFWGGEGSDEIHIADSSGFTQIFAGEDNADTDSLVFDNVTSTSGVNLTFGGWETGSYTFGGTSGQFWEVERVVGTQNDDHIHGSNVGSSLILEGGGGDDTIIGGGAADTIDGGSGDDQLTGGQGDDVLTGGAGSDTFVVWQGTGDDTMTDFDMTLVDGRTNDQLDVSALRTPNGEAVNATNITVSDDGAGNAVLSFPGGESLTLNGVTPAQASSQMYAMGIPCVARGTLIRTPAGARRVEDLRAGDLVLTLDHGAQPILWSGCRTVSRPEGLANPGQRPVLIRAGVLGNDRDLLASPQHCLLIRQDGREVLARARHLAEAGLGRIRVARGKPHVHYHHILTARHEVLFANGALSESLYPGRHALAALGPDAIRDLFRCHPGLNKVFAGILSAQQVYGPTSRPVLTRTQLLRAARAGTVTLNRPDGDAHRGDQVVVQAMP